MQKPSLPIGGEALRPQARITDLIVQELPDEELVYDLKTHQAYCLNKTASEVWKQCDGQTTISAMAQMLSCKLQTEINEDWVCLALNQLSRVHLLEQSVLATAKISRRQVVRKLMHTAVLTPLITTVIAPTAQAANTCVGQACSPSGINGVDCPCTRCCGRAGSPTSAAPRVCQLFQALSPGSPCNADCMCASNDCISAPPLTPTSWTCA